MGSAEIIFLAILLVFAIAALAYAYRHQCLLRERAQIMRDAIRHRDFSFRLPTRGLFFGEKALQEALNDMGQDIQKQVAHSEVKSWQKLTRVLTHEIMNAITPIQSISQAYLKNLDISCSSPQRPSDPYLCHGWHVCLPRMENRKCQDFSGMPG